jgi:hypothetical protein
MIGTAVFVSTFECAAALLNKLMEENLLEQIPIQYHHPNPGNGLGRNMVILIPNYQGSPQQYYHTIMTPAEEEISFCPASLR